MYDVLIKLERHDGNDPFEVMKELPIVPREGDALEVPTSDGVAFLDVEYVVLSFGVPAIEAWVSYDGYDLAEVERIFAAIEVGG